MRVSNFSNTTNWSELEAAVTLITVRTANTRCCLYGLDTKTGVKKKPQWIHKIHKKNDHLQSQQTYQQSSKYPIIPGCSRSNTQSFHVLNVQQKCFPFTKAPGDKIPSQQKCFKPNQLHQAFPTSGSRTDTGPDSDSESNRIKG